MEELRSDVQENGEFPHLWKSLTAQMAAPANAAIAAAASKTLVTALWSSSSSDLESAADSEAQCDKIKNQGSWFYIYIHLFNGINSESSAIITI